ncbi:hypothetical protein BN2476_750053 [Paraburkholderia piptadeniae]|uniref:Uncharacterized protein n=1 Tax=Paraburkholderia piptadeniae TaxID=1701573 RepID=A0A1N7SS14_9BURK|nr:hypothetical protein BN2476_750053 [Paraburkholderia piptadeniae]
MKGRKTRIACFRAGWNIRAHAVSQVTRHRAFIALYGALLRLIVVLVQQVPSRRRRRLPTIAEMRDGRACRLA